MTALTKHLPRAYPELTQGLMNAIFVYEEAEQRKNKVFGKCLPLFHAQGQDLSENCKEAP